MGAAILAAALYAVNVPLAKLFVKSVGPAMMASLLYLGAGFGLVVFSLFMHLFGKKTNSSPLTLKDAPAAIGMVVLDIAAPILLMNGIALTSSSTVSLLNNFEIVATSLIASFFFHESISKRLWAAILLVFIASLILSFDYRETLRFDRGAALVLLATLCWGLENNCTRVLSNKSAIEIVQIKGICSGFGALAIAFGAGERLPSIPVMALVLLLGFISYGLSIVCYIKAQSGLGAAATSAFYSIAPFLGVFFGFLLFADPLYPRFLFSLCLMIFATIIMAFDTLRTAASV